MGSVGTCTWLLLAPGGHWGNLLWFLLLIPGLLKDKLRRAKFFKSLFEQK